MASTMRARKVVAGSFHCVIKVNKPRTLCQVA
jgi:hypothetical protein